MQVESTFGDEPYGMHLILTWLGGQVHLPPHELCAHLPGECCSILELPKDYQGPVTQDWAALGV